MQSHVCGCTCKYFMAHLGFRVFFVLSILVHSSTSAKFVTVPSMYRQLVGILWNLTGHRDMCIPSMKKCHALIQGICKTTSAVRKLSEGTSGLAKSSFGCDVIQKATHSYLNFFLSSSACFMQISLVWLGVKYPLICFILFHLISGAVLGGIMNDDN